MAQTTYTVETLSDGGKILRYADGSECRITAPFPVGEAGERIRRNASQIAYQIAARIAAEQENKGENREIGVETLRADSFEK